jgi:hypothetical protein
MRLQLVGLSMIILVGCGGSGTPEPTHVTSATLSTRSALTGSAAMDTAKKLDQGPEAGRLQKLVGIWDVVMTTRPNPNAPPQVVRGLVAERTMHGNTLEERLRPAQGAPVATFERIDYMAWDPVQTRWEYAALDSRAPGIVFAKGFDRASGGGFGGASEITVYADNFANSGANELGGIVRARHVDYLESNDYHVKQEFWTKPGAPEWLAAEYVYTRAKAH